MNYNNLRIQHDTEIERTADDIISIVCDDNNIEQIDDEGMPTSTETWLAVKARILALLEAIAS